MLGKDRLKSQSPSLLVLLPSLSLLQRLKLLSPSPGTRFPTPSVDTGIFPLCKKVDLEGLSLRWTTVELHSGHSGYRLQTGCLDFLLFKHNEIRWVNHY